MKRIRIILFISIAFLSNNLKAQFTSAIIGIDGLTCSACSYATEKSIRKLDFVDSVFMELDKNIATVFFKKNSTVSIQLLSKKVYDAGFAVRSIYASYNFNNLNISNDFCLLQNNTAYHFVKIENEKKLNGIVSLHFIGEKYMQKKEFKNWKLFLTNSCKTSFPQITTEYYITLN
ncbi:MAG: heavy-metal-associated domain-containing protein [Bacteroidia bacterium]|nr:heavy-metal-associated domain-containing protein [Bacteroidia bacterium]